MTLDPDCVSAWIDNSTASANRRPKIRLVVRSVLNSEVCMAFWGLFLLFVCLFDFLDFFFFCECCGFFFNIWNPEQHAGMWSAVNPIFIFFSVILLLQALHTFKVDINFELFSIVCIPTYIEGWLLLHVSLELLIVYVITQQYFFCLSRLFLYIKMSFLNCQLPCSWRERNLRELRLWRSQLHSSLCDYLEQ